MFPELTHTDGLEVVLQVIIGFDKSTIRNVAGDSLQLADELEAPAAVVPQAALKT